MNMDYEAAYKSMRDERDKVQKRLDIACADSFDTEECIRKACEPILEAEYIAGDDYEVPCIETLVDKLIERIK